MATSTPKVCFSVHPGVTRLRKVSGELVAGFPVAINILNEGDDWETGHSYNFSIRLALQGATIAETTSMTFDEDGMICTLDLSDAIDSFASSDISKTFIVQLVDTDDPVSYNPPLEVFVYNTAYRV